MSGIQSCFFDLTLKRHIARNGPAPKKEEEQLNYINEIWDGLKDLSGQCSVWHKMCFILLSSV